MIKNRLRVILGAVVIAGAVVGSVYGFADSIEFDLDRPAWKSELDVQGEVVYELAQNSILNQLDRAERRYDQIKRRRFDPGARHSREAIRAMDEDLRFYRRKITDLKSQYNKYDFRRRR